MTQDFRQIAIAASKLVNRLPHHAAVALASEIARCVPGRWQSTRRIILNRLPTAEFRDVAVDFLECWHKNAGDLEPATIAAALVSAAEVEKDRRERELIEVAWTGPDFSQSRFRRTEQAILEVLNSASRRLTIVSYAVYRIPRIRDALVAAASRGVSIRIIVETPNRVDGQGEYDCLLALGTNVAQVASVYYWPQCNRERDENGKFGRLHVKCAVADGNCLFLSSANFTEYAFTINMELGLLVTGGKLPQRVEHHFEMLIDNDVLQPVTA